MSITSLWDEIETELLRIPVVAATLRPPVTQRQLERWSSVVGPLPASVQELYDRHDGTEVLGGSGFSFIADWYPLSVDRALDRYALCRQLTDVFGSPPLIPFAVNAGGCHLAVPVDGGNQLHFMFDDSPPMLYDDYPSIEGLLSATVEGLRGDSTEYRAELHEQYLAWINLEEEADDLGN